MSLPCSEIFPLATKAYFREKSYCPSKIVDAIVRVAVTIFLSLGDLLFLPFRPCFWAFREISATSNPVVSSASESREKPQSKNDLEQFDKEFFEHLSKGDEKTFRSLIKGLYRLYKQQNKRDSFEAFRQTLVHLAELLQSQGGLRVSPKQILLFCACVGKCCLEKGYRACVIYELFEPYACSEGHKKSIQDILNNIFSTLHRGKLQCAMIYGSPSWSNTAIANYIIAKM